MLAILKTKIIEASALGKLWVMILKNTVFKVRSQEVVLQLWLY
jgi:hypothetical protein